MNPQASARDARAPLPGYVMLEDGTRFDGELCGASDGDSALALGEVVLITSLTG